MLLGGIDPGPAGGSRPRTQPQPDGVLTSTRTAPVARLVRHDREEPRPERRAGAEPAEVAVGLDHRLLHRVLGVGSGDRVADPERDGSMTLEQRGERDVVAVAGAFDELGIGNHGRPSYTAVRPRVPGGNRIGRTSVASQ